MNKNSYKNSYKCNAQYTMSRCLDAVLMHNAQYTMHNLNCLEATHGEGKAIYMLGDV